MKPRQAVVVAMPDQMHYEVVMEALKNSQTCFASNLLS